MRSTVFICLMTAIVACRDSPAPLPVASTSLPVPTFSRDIAPIVSKHCATCHRPGQGAPFVLLTYDDVRQRARDVVAATRAQKMPPWLPDSSSPAFEGERRLSADDIETIRRWVAGGASADVTPATVSASHLSSGWQFGQPDLILRPAAAFPLKPGGDDVFRNLVVQTNLPAGRYIRAVEFQPGDVPVHHAVLHLDSTPASRQRNGSDGRPGFDGMGGMGIENPDGHFVGWAPGRGPIVSAQGRPWRLARGTDVVIELHLIPGKVETAVRPTIALYFADAPGEAAPLMLKLGDPPIDIPPGAIDYAISDRYVLPVDVRVLSLYPHAHYLGKNMRVEAMLPGGGSKTLLHIPRWSFHWQQDYRYQTPVALPRGTTIAMRFTYDNSDANEDNPHHPPVRVFSGRRSIDEMGNLLVQMVPEAPADRVALVRDMSRYQALRSLETAERLAKADPANPDHLASLGAGYVDAGRPAEAIPVLERALRLAPESSRIHNELGGALLATGRVADAVIHFRAAVKSAATDSKLQFNLGKALSAAGSAADAETALRRAIQLNPNLAEAHDELGVLLFARGRLAEALGHLQRAVELAPDSAIHRSDYGGALAQAGRRDEALVQLRRALELDPGNQAAKENLARLQR